MKRPAPIDGVDVVPSQMPLEERTVKVLGPGEVTSVNVLSPHTNEPSWVAFACVPAAKLELPRAVLLLPPATVE